MLVALAAFFWHPAPLKALAHDPFFAWQSLSSPHFEVHFHEGLEPLAPQVAAICERRWQELHESFRFAPEDKIQVLLTDEMDEANGSATPWPRNTVTLIAAPFDENGEVFDIDAYLDYVISHELVHIFQLDHARAYPHAMRRIFGRFPLFFPNLFEPSWMLEGLAVWGETDPLRRVGRAQDAYFRGMMRLELEAGLKPLRQVNQPVASWPAGSTRYLYGSYFMEYLDWRYGHDSLRRWVEDYSDDVVPYFINRSARRVFHKKLPALWKDFSSWLKSELGPSMEALKARGLRGAPADLDPQGAYAWGPFRDGVAVRRDGLRPSRLQRLKGRHWEDLANAEVIRFWPGQGRILYTEDELIHQGQFTRDLWELKEGSSCPRRLSHGLRVQEAVEIQGRILAVLGSLGERRLAWLNNEGSVEEVLWEGHEGDNPASLCPSPDGKKIAASLWRRGQGWDIEEFDLESRLWRKLASRPESEVQPSYSADGRIIYFSASYGQVFNIYAMDAETGELLRQVTDVLGGAFHPWADSSGKVYFSLLTAKGRVLGEVLDDPAACPPDELPKAGPGFLPPQPKRLEPLRQPEISPYQPLESLWPSYWIPVLDLSSGGTLVGAEIASTDLLERHSLGLEVLGVYGRYHDAFGSLDYAYTRWLPNLEIQAGRGLNHATDSQGRIRDQVSEDWAALLSFPWISSRQSMGLWAGAGQSHSWDYGGDFGSSPFADSLRSAFSVEAAYDSTQTQALALGAADGIQATAQWTLAEPGRADEGSWWAASLGRPCSLAWGALLEASLGAGAVDAGPYSYQLDLKPSFRPTKLSFSPLYRLDGYAAGLPELNGRSYGVAHLGLNLPIARIERGIMAPPLGADKIWARIYGDETQAYSDQALGQGLKPDLGIELDSTLVLGYEVGLDLSLGLVQGLGSGGISQLYLRLGGSGWTF
jgi:hypothetical protein